MNSDTYAARDSVDDGAGSVPGYTAAEAAHAIQLFLDGGLSLEGFSEWLNGYPYGKVGPQPDEVEDQINRATLAVRGAQRGSRDSDDLRRELSDIRSRLSGFGYSSGQEVGTGQTTTPSGRPVDRSFP